MKSNMMLTVTEGHSDRDAKVRKRAKGERAEKTATCVPPSFFVMLNYLVNST